MCWLTRCFVIYKYPSNTCTQWNVKYLQKKKKFDNIASYCLSKLDENQLSAAFFLTMLTGPTLSPEHLLCSLWTPSQYGHWNKNVGQLTINIFLTWHRVEKNTGMGTILGWPLHSTRQRCFQLKVKDTSIRVLLRESCSISPK